MKKRLVLFPNFKRETRTRIAYIALSVGTVAASFLLVLLNRAFFRIAEVNLYNEEHYEVVNIISAESIGAPLPRETTLQLFARCTTEGTQRAPLPEELTEQDVTTLLNSLLGETLNLYANDNGWLDTGESVTAVLGDTRYVCVLRDFFDEETGAKLARWCTQAYYTAADGRVYCLSVQFDTRTGDPLALTCALFENIDRVTDAENFLPILSALHYDNVSLLANTHIESTDYGKYVTLNLPDGLQLQMQVTTDTQVEISFSPIA